MKINKLVSLFRTVTRINQRNSDSTIRHVRSTIVAEKLFQKIQI